MRVSGRCKAGLDKRPQGLERSPICVEAAKGRPRRVVVQSKKVTQFV